MDSMRNETINMSKGLGREGLMSRSPFIPLFISFITNILLNEVRMSVDCSQLVVIDTDAVNTSILTHRGVQYWKPSLHCIKNSIC